MSRMILYLITIIFLIGCNNSSKLEIVDNVEFSYDCQPNHILIVGNEEMNNVRILYNGKIFDKFLDQSEFKKVLSSYGEYEFPPVATCDAYGARVVFLPKEPSKTRNMLAIYFMNDGAHDFSTLREPL